MSVILCFLIREVKYVVEQNVQFVGRPDYLPGNCNAYKGIKVRRGKSTPIEQYDYHQVFH